MRYGSNRAREGLAQRRGQGVPRHHQRHLRGCAQRVVVRHCIMQRQNDGLLTSGAPGARGRSGGSSNPTSAPVAAHATGPPSAPGSVRASNRNAAGDVPCGSALATQPAATHAAKCAGASAPKGAPASTTGAPRDRCAADAQRGVNASCARPSTSRTATQSDAPAERAAAGAAASCGSSACSGRADGEAGGQPSAHAPCMSNGCSATSTAADVARRSTTDTTRADRQSAGDDVARSTSMRAPGCSAKRL